MTNTDLKLPGDVTPFLMSCWPCIVIYPYNMNQQDALFLLIYFSNRPLHVSSRLAARHQEDQLCYADWLLPAASQHKTRLYQLLFMIHLTMSSNSKHVGAYYWNKLIGNNTSCWFIVYGCYTMSNGKLLPTLQRTSTPPNLVSNKPRTLP
jgi:hypothetical protein